MAFDRALMGLLSFFRSNESVAKPVPLQKSRELWRKSDFIAKPAGEDLQVIYSRGGAPKVFPTFAIDFALGCLEFSPLEVHLSEYAVNRGWSSLQAEALQAWAPQLIEAGALISQSEVHRQCQSSGGSANEVPLIGAIGFPTGGDRVEMLDRALQSFVKNVKAHGRTADFIVADCSAKPAQRDAFRTRLRALRREHNVPIYYSGEEEKRRFAAALIKESGCSPEAVEFALFDPLEAGFTCGANRNALLLHEAGRTLCSVDDDVICRLAAAPDADPKLSLFSSCDPFSRWFYKDRESAYDSADWRDVDFLAMHEELLGRDLSSLATEVPQLGRITDEMLRRLDSGPTRVRATFNGHIGDPGIPTSVFYLYYHGENRRRLTESEAHYRCVFSSRSMLAVSSTRALGDSSVSPGMAMGLDHRQLLPPFFPVLHAEDSVFGALLWQCCPGALLGHLPFAVQHESALGKKTLLPSDLNSENRAMIHEFAQIMRALVLGVYLGDHFTSESRMAFLGSHLVNFAKLPRRDFQECFRAHVIGHVSTRILFFEEELRKDTDSPEYWRRDQADYINHLREAIEHDDFDIPFELKTGRTADATRHLMQALIGRFGELLLNWPAMVDAAKVLRQRGQTISTHLD